MIKVTERLNKFRVSILFLLICFLSGCTDSGPVDTQYEAKLQPTPAAVSPLTFGIIYPMAHPYYETITQAAIKAAEPHGIRLIVKAPDEANLEQQIRMVETMIAQKVDGIAIAPIDSEAIIPVINKAVQAGITVICFESDSPKSSRAAYIGPDNKAAGVQMGQMLDTLLEGNGMVIVESGVSSMTSLRERLSGMLAYVRNNTDIQILEVHHHEGEDMVALTQLEKMIDDHPHFDAYVSIDVVSTSTAVLVWKAQGLKRHALTFGMMQGTMEALRNGQITSALSLEEELWGQYIIELLQQAASGEAIPSRVDTPMTEVTGMGLTD